MDVLASIPSPSNSVIEVGPLTFRAYGLFVALGVMAGYIITQRRWAARGGDPDDIARIAMWAIPAGVVGARLYHVMTDYQRFQGNWGESIAIWKGGLAIWGAIAGGALAAIIYSRAKHLDTATLLECAAPALPVGQAIGRLGNYFNQELFGKPTSLPWGLEIDVDNRPSQYLAEATFHPTFLYEALWNLALALFIIWVGKHVRLPRGRLFLVYVAGYTFVRFFMELLRVDPASQVAGIRINVWVTTVVFLAAVWGLVTSRDRRLAPADTRPVRVWSNGKWVNPPGWTAVESDADGDDESDRDWLEVDDSTSESAAEALARAAGDDVAISGNVVNDADSGEPDAGVGSDE